MDIYIYIICSYIYNDTMLLSDSCEIRTVNQYISWYR